MFPFRRILAMNLGLCVGVCFLFAEPPKADLAGYRTVEKAITAKVRAAAPGTAGQTGYLGVAVERDKEGRLVIDAVQPESPGAKAGLKKGDIITHVGEQAVKSPEAFREWLQTNGPDESIKLGLLRDGKAVQVTAKLIATSRPLRGSGTRRAVLGFTPGDVKEGEGVRIEQVAPGGGAAAAGMKSGDYLFKIDGADVSRTGRLSAVLSEKNPGDVVKLTVRRDGKEIELKATMQADTGGRESRGSIGLWNKEIFRLAVVCIEFPDTKHNAKVPTKEWEDAFFSRNQYDKKSATGQAVHGSLNDYFHEQSAGAFHLKGKVFEWVEVSKKRADYAQGTGTSNKTALPTEALDKIAARDGKDAFKDFDGFLFIYAGERVRTNAGSLYYPHAGTISSQSQRRPYLLGAEGGSRMSSISAFVKEFGEVLGLPDLAARSDNAGSTGLGPWCAMSDTLGNGRPQHLCAWAKEKLGWLKPAVIDPTVKQKLILSPIEDAPKECIKVLVRPDGSEYFLLENRRKKGFDADLPGEGLLIWRVVQGRPILEESHGVEGPTGPTVHLSAVPYPSAANTSFTPETIPSSRSPVGGGLPVWITEIRRLPDGRIALHVGYEYR